MKKVLLILLILSSCSVTRNVQKDESTLQTATSETNNVSVLFDSLSLQSARINRLTTEYNSVKNMLEITRERMLILEVTNIQEKEYYESGALRSERITDNNRQTKSDKETVNNSEERINFLEVKFDSVCSEFNELKKEFAELQDKFDGLKATTLRANSQFSTKNKMSDYVVAGGLLISILGCLFFTWKRFFRKNKIEL